MGGAGWRGPRARRAPPDMRVPIDPAWA